MQVAENPDILLLGSSHMEARNIMQDENVAYLLDKKLGDDYTVYNMGISGHHFTGVCKYFSASLALYEETPEIVVIETDNTFFTVQDVETLLQGNVDFTPSHSTGIVATLLCLGYFKYTNFFVESFSNLFGKTDYVALYLSFFPKFTSGSIQRSRDFFSQVDFPRIVGWDSFSCGIQIFFFGVFKKLVLADWLSVFVNQIYDTPVAFSSLTVFLAVLVYSLQIYFDFSGYSAITIGAARIPDIHLPRNFNLPYLSHNVTEFWKRWHITLSFWLQEYLYISLGGNRSGTICTYVNLILMMVIGGIWHGSKWTYIVWGFHGIALAVHKIWIKVTDSPKKKHSIMSNVLSVSATFLFTSLCWVLLLFF